MWLRLRRWWRRWHPTPRLGQQGERAAEKFLKRRGLTIVARSARDRIGELDLVAVEGRVVVFVEVKTRTSHDAGHPFEAIDSDKQRRLTRAALSYMKRHDLLECAARFDVIAITWPDDSKEPTIEHVRNAFEPVGLGQMFA
jgi:putative endonuclease